MFPIGQVTEAVTMSKKTVLSEASQLSATIEFHITKDIAKSYLMQCIRMLTQIPDAILEMHQLKASGSEQTLLISLRKRQFAISTWLSHFLFNRGRKTPEGLKSSYLKSYEEEARYSESVLRLAEGVCDAVGDKLSWMKPDHVSDDDLPAAVWFSCEIGWICAEIQNSGLGLSLGIPDMTTPGTPLATKEKTAKFFRDWANRLESPASEFIAYTPKTNNRKLPYYLFPYVSLTAEGKQLADTSDDFAGTYWEPYVKAVRRWANVIRKDHYRQIPFLLPDGSIIYGAKNHKRFKGFGQL